MGHVSYSSGRRLSRSGPSAPGAAAADGAPAPGCRPGKAAACFARSNEGGGGIGGRGGAGGDGADALHAPGAPQWQGPFRIDAGKEEPHGLSDAELKALAYPALRPERERVVEEREFCEFVM